MWGHELPRAQGQWLLGVEKGRHEMASRALLKVPRHRVSQEHAVPRTRCRGCGWPGVGPSDLKQRQCGCASGPPHPWQRLLTRGQKGHSMLQNREACWTRAHHTWRWAEGTPKQETGMWWKARDMQICKSHFKNTMRATHVHYRTFFKILKYTKNKV